MKKLLPNILLAGALYVGAGPNAVVDLQTGQVDPIIHNGPGADFVLAQPNRQPEYVVPMPDAGAGPSLYVQPGGVE